MDSFRQCADAETLQKGFADRPSQVGSAEAKAAVIELSTICKRSMIAQLNTIEIKRKQIKTQLLKPIPNQTCHCHVVTGARVSRPQCQAKCQTSLVTELDYT